MTTLYISLFGTVDVAHNCWSSKVKLSPKAQTLFSYLLTQGKRLHAREVLIHQIWGDYPIKKGRGCLSTTLWRLRRAVKSGGISPGTYLETSPSGEIGFNWDSDYWLDVTIFENQIKALFTQPLNQIPHADIQVFENTLKLYMGNFLEGFYDDWVLREQERLYCLYLDALDYLMRYYRLRGMYEASLTYGHHILSHEPIREITHREMIRLHLENGQRTLAIQQYEICEEVLAKELNISPMQETQSLYLQARQLSRSQDISNDHHDLQQAIQVFSHAVQDFEAAQHQLKAAKRRLDQSQLQLQQGLHMVEQLCKAFSPSRKSK